MAGALGWIATSIRISTGHYEHIALFFGHNVFGTGPDAYLLYNAKLHSAHSPALMGLLTNVSGTGTLPFIGLIAAMLLLCTYSEEASLWSLRLLG